MQNFVALTTDQHDASRIDEMRRALEFSEEKYRKAFYLTPDSMNINRLDDGLFVSINRGFTLITGYTEADVLGKTSIEIDIWADHGDRDRLVQVLRKEGQVTNLEAQFRTKDGAIIDSLMSAAVIEIGDTPHIISITRDITDRKKAEIRRQQSEEKYRRLANDMPVFVVTFSPSGTLTFVNEGIARLVHMDTSQLMGMNFFDFLNPFDCQLVQSKLAQLTPEKPVETHEQTYQEPRGGLAFHQWTNRAFFDDKGFITYYQAVGVDITERKQAEAALSASEERWKFAIEGAGDGLWDWNIQTGKAFYSPHYKAMLGFADDEIGDTAEEWSKRIHQEDLPSVFAALQPYIDGKQGNASVEFRMLCKDGRWMWTLGRGMVAERDANGKAMRMIGTNSDITGRKLTEAKLQLAARVFEHAREGIFITDAHGIIVDINESFTRITGYSREESTGQNPHFLSSGHQDSAFYIAMWDALKVQGHWSGEIWNRRKDGEVYAELLTISAVRDEQGNVQQYVALFSDITVIKSHQSQLEHMAHFDALTNLPNRLLLADRLKQTMAQAKRRGKQLAVVYLDLDGFKGVNDRHGHDAGDQLLITLASAMEDTLREGDTLARIGGDEFVAVLIDLDGVESCVPLLTRLLDAAAGPVPMGEIVLQASASVGVTFYPQANEMEADQLLRQADQAMYQAKLAGKNRFHIFDSAQDSSIRMHHEKVGRVGLALKDQEFVLHYQPKVNMRSGQVIGVEALIRWQHPEKGLLLPQVFLPVIEDDPLSIAVGEWVIDAALNQIELWRTASLDLPVSVNIGAHQLQQSNFVERLQAILSKHPQVNPSCLQLEILETSALADLAQVSRVIEDCARIGVKFGLDDFGTGYSSLTYLKRLRVALLKIDQSFVREMLDDPEDLAILQGVIGLAAAFKCEVIAEGVESQAHGDLLLKLGCDLAQGYGIAKPMPAIQFPAWMASWQRYAEWCEQPNSFDTSHFSSE